MAREKVGYRDQLALILDKYQSKMLTVQEVADFLDCNQKTVLNNINRRYNPLPAINVAVGRKMWRIAATDLARWSLG